VGWLGAPSVCSAARGLLMIHLIDSGSLVFASATIRTGREEEFARGLHTPLT
jgi:hypothetical protein